ncbi:DMT family transporter [Peribacillus sp. FSL K6-1552]|uniref:DMT family transporter n=1 Tax=Peribacillus sp. FSL K6-1552 TaxID=2954514 RepID=UPI0030FD0697
MRIESLNWGVEVIIVGLAFALIVGLLVSSQNIINSKVNENIGSWAATTLVLGMESFTLLMIGLIVEEGILFALQNMKPWYWFSVLTGVGVVISIMRAIKLLGPRYASSIL